MLKLAVGSILPILLALAVVSAAGANQPDVQIVQLECDSDPELVIIGNEGDEQQDLTGWELQSDPVDSEVFDLSVLGSLPAGGSVTIQAGPSASGVFVWADVFVFGDNDATDYARIVDDTGALVHQVNCGDAGAEPSPTPTAEPSPTPTAEPSPVNGVPNGGGPPPLSGDSLMPATVALIGGLLAALGLAAFTLSWLRLRPSLATSAPSRGRSAARLRAQRTEGRPGRGLLPTGFGLAIVGFFAAVVIELISKRR